MECPVHELSNYIATNASHPIGSCPSVKRHENGRLKQDTLSRAAVIKGVEHGRKTSVRIDEKGQVIHE